MRILLLLLITLELHAQKSAVQPAPTTDYFRYAIESLANDSMYGRLPGTPQEKKSADFIASQLKASGSKPLKRKHFTQPFEYTGPDSLIVRSTGNVIAKINTPSNFCIVVTAHYDHIGHGLHHSSNPFDHGIYNGADDNASGVAMLLAMSAWCNQNKSLLRYDIIFAALSGEEDGLYGSIQFLNGHCIDTSKIICNINFDMVGHLDIKRPILVAEGVVGLSAWDSVLPKDTNSFFFVQRNKIMLKGGSDHCTFTDAGIPAVLFTTGVTAYYHRTSDDIGTINFMGMEKIAQYMEELLRNLNKTKALNKMFGRLSS